MMFIMIGCLAFGIMLIYDLNKIYWNHKSINYFFFVGCALLLLATMGLLLGDYQVNYVPITWQIVFYLFSAIGLILLLASLFIWLPFGKTYLNYYEPGSVLDVGMYALCRHPGVLWFFVFYVFLWLATGKTVVLYAAISWTFMDLLYVYIQDKWLFPKSLIGYEKYKMEVPFIIPSLTSINKCWSSFLSL